MGWIQDLIKPEARQWEEFYRNRWQHDNVIRSTHGVNCTGGCSWAIYVKDGIITWEMQQVDYPLLEPHLPPYEPRGCQRGISASWYVYSPIRVKYPYARGAFALAATLVMALGMGVANAAVFKLVAAKVPQAIGGASGWVGGLGAFGGFVLPPLLGAFVRAGGVSGYATGFVVYVALAALSLGLVFLLARAHGSPLAVDAAG